MTTKNPDGYRMFSYETKQSRSLIKNISLIIQYVLGSILREEKIFFKNFILLIVFNLIFSLLIVVESNLCCGSLKTNVKKNEIF